MARLAAECTAQWIQRSRHLGVGAGAGMRCRQLLREHLDSAYSITPSSLLLFYSRSFYVIVIDFKSRRIYVLLLLSL
jgi:hypothetical protein